MERYFAIFGRVVRDRVTGFQGVCESIAFDLYGCVQALVRPKLDKDGQHREAWRLDVKRLELIGDKPVMEVPDFSQPETGPASKPLLPSKPIR